MPKRFAGKKDYHPDCRVIIEEEPAVYRFDKARRVFVRTKASKLTELKSFTSVKTTASTSGKTSANLTFASHHDAAYNLAKKRDRETRRQREISEYLSDVLKMSDLKEVNPKRRERTLFDPDRRVLGKVPPLNVIARGLGAISAYIKEQDNGHQSATNPPKDREDEYRSYEWFVGQFKLMRRIWIDFKDNQDRWVAGFTGIVSSLQDSLTSGESPVLTVSCSGMMRFWEMSEYIYKSGLDILDWPFPTSAKLLPNFSVFTNNLEGMDALEIMIEMASYVNRWFSYTGFDYKNLDLISGLEVASVTPESASLSSDTALANSRSPEDYYYHDKIISIEPERATKHLDQWEIDFDPVRVLPPDNDITGTSIESRGRSLTGQLFIDSKCVGKNVDERDVISKMVRNSFELYSFEAASPYRIVQDIASMMGFDWFEDPKGNICLWTSKHDELPRLDTATGIAVGKRKELTDKDLASDLLDLGSAAITPLGPGHTTTYGDDYSTLPFHDDRYIIDDPLLKSWTLTSTEEGLTTFCLVSSQPHLIEGLPEDLGAVSNMGRTSFQQLSAISRSMAEYVVRLNRRFGLRRATLNPILTTAIPDDVQLLTRYAYAGLIKANAHNFSGVVTLFQRPDIWAGRNVFLAERQKLGYITQVTNNFTMKQPHVTTLTLAYVHDPSVRIGNPWLDAVGKAKSTTAQPIDGLFGEVFSDGIR